VVVGQKKVALIIKKVIVRARQPTSLGYFKNPKHVDIYSVIGFDLEKNTTICPRPLPLSCLNQKNSGWTEKSSFDD
jgi:hypothetical protein